MNHRKILKELIAKEDLPKKRMLVGMFEKDYRSDLQEALKYISDSCESIMVQAKREQLEKVRKELSELKDLPMKKEEFYSFLDTLFSSDKLEDRALGVYL